MEGTEETTKPQEILSSSNEFTALQGRILLKGSALDPNNANIVESDINQEKLSDRIFHHQDCSHIPSWPASHICLQLVYARPRYHFHS